MIIIMALLWTLTGPCLSSVGGPRAEHSGVSTEPELQVRSLKSKVEGENHLTQPAGHALFDVAQDTVGFLGCKFILPGHIQFFIHQYPQIHSSLSLCSHLGLPQPKCGKLHLALLSFMRFTQAHFSSLPLLMASLLSSMSTTLLSLVSSVNLLRLYSVPLSKSLTKMLNSTGPLGDNTHYWSPPGHRDVDCNSEFDYPANFLSSEWSIHQIHVSPF